MRLVSSITLVMAFLLLLSAGCSSRVDTWVTTSDSTIVYPSKKDNGIEAKIRLFRKISKKTGKLIGEGRVFTIKQNRKLRALVELDKIPDQELLLHIVWLGPDQKPLHRKQLQRSPGDTTSINSYISISPETRQAGKYTLQVFLFRELIAEKEFELLPEFWFTTAEAEKTEANIVFYRKMSKKNPEKRIGEDTVFTLRKKRNLRAVVKVKNRSVFAEHELKFNLNWFGPDGKIFYKKQIEFPPGDTTLTLNSSISISPDKRKAGNYTLRVLLFKEMIGEKQFELMNPSK